MRPTRFAFAAIPALLLAACAEEEVAVPQGTDGREASGEVLPASVSDDMIATDRLRSQPPLMVDVPDAPTAAPSDSNEVADEVADEPASVAATSNVADAEAQPEQEIAPAEAERPALDLPPEVLDLPPE